MGLSLALGLVYVLPLLLVPSKGLDPEKRLKAENDLRGVLVQAVGGSILLVGTARTLHINREGQITERFTRAIEQLGHDTVDVRLGGIYALERIGRESRPDRGPIVEVLTAFLREHARWRPSDDRGAAGSDGSRLRADFQAAATVLARSGWSHEHRFDLSGIDLRGINLNDGHLEGAVLVDAHLEGALLNDAHLERALLLSAHLEGAVLGDAHLESAILSNAHLERAYLGDAHLQKAIVGYAHLNEACLVRAHLEDADFSGAQFDGADLSGAHLQGTHLHGAIGLDAQIGS